VPLARQAIVILRLPGQSYLPLDFRFTPLVRDRAAAQYDAKGHELTCAALVQKRGGILWGVLDWWPPWSKSVGNLPSLTGAARGRIERTGGYRLSVLRARQ
jgi:hypothetical protein